MKLIIGICMIIIGLAIPVIVYGGIGYIIYRAVKSLIRYHAECQDRYTRYREAEQEASELESELEYMANEYDWSKKP